MSSPRRALADQSSVSGFRRDRNEPPVNLSRARLADNTVGGVTRMIPTVGQTLSVRGPDGRTQRGKIVSAYRSTGGFLSFWIDLDDCFANPANRATDDCTTRMLVLTERERESTVISGTDNGNWILSREIPSRWASDGPRSPRSSGQPNSQMSRTPGCPVLYS